jgi:hypothetical protein
MSNNASGENPNPEGEENTDELNKQDYVKYENYVKSVNSEKNTKARLREKDAELNEYKARESAQKEHDLLAKDEHLKVIAGYKEQNELLNNQLAQKAADDVKVNKLHGFVHSLGNSKLDPKYLGLVPVDLIEVDDQGKPIPESLSKVVNNFKAEHPRLLIQQTKDLPGQSPTSGGGSMSVEEWKKLGSSKEMTEKRHLVDFPHKRK